LCRSASRHTSPRNPKTFRPKSNSQN